MNTTDLKQMLFTVMGTLLHESRKYLDAQFKVFDLTRNEWIILALLRVNPDGVSQHYAKSYIGIENSYFTKLLNKLESKQFIIRTKCPDDRRNKIITLHPKSLTKTKQIFQIIEDHNAEIHMDLNKKELQTIHDALNGITNRLNAIKARH